MLAWGSVGRFRYVSRGGPRAILDDAPASRERLVAGTHRPAGRLVDESLLSIGELAARAGVAEGTLRMWETRYGFPTAQRLPSGHRRYSEDELRRVIAVVRVRREGLSLPRAIDRVRRLEAEPRPSVYRALRDRFEHLQPQLLTKPAMLWLSQAIEDECCWRSPRPLLFAGFQHERFYRQSEQRWRNLAVGAERALVLADFARVRRPRGGPVEVPIAVDDPMTREWVLVCDAPEACACLAGWERPSGRGEIRLFEMVWTIEPLVVREAALVCCDLAARRAPDIAGTIRERLAAVPTPAPEEQVQLALALATRVTAYANGSPASGLPASE
jgi:MerR family transcriptional regulator, light-induced transcriptional regulator